jgi:hypothetical protein
MMRSFDFSPYQNKLLFRLNSSGSLSINRNTMHENQAMFLLGLVVYLRANVRCTLVSTVLEGRQRFLR